MNIAKIKSMKKIKFNSNLYDIETKNNHNFFANGVLVHNSNFSLWTDGTEVKVASRTQFVDGQFYNCQEVFDRYKDAVLELKNYYFPKAEQIGVYGELYGPNIQKGVYYSERKDFRAFEIRVDENEIVKPMRAKMLFAQTDIPQVPYINIYANIYDALAENNEFQSKVQEMDDQNGPGLVKFIEFKEGENTAEGIVIQPLEDVLYTGNGARVILKSKSKLFMERSSKKSKKSKKVDELHKPLVTDFVNINRMNSVLSKFGEPTQKDFGKIIGLMCADVLNDMIKDGEIPLKWNKTEKYKTIGKTVSNIVSKFLKEHLLENI